MTASSQVLDLVSVLQACKRAFHDWVTLLGWRHQIGGRMSRPSPWCTNSVSLTVLVDRLARDNIHARPKEGIIVVNPLHRSCRD